MSSSTESKLNVGIVVDVVVAFHHRNANEWKHRSASPCDCGVALPSGTSTWCIGSTIRMVHRYPVPKQMNIPEEIVPKRQLACMLTWKCGFVHSRSHTCSSSHISGREKKEGKIGVERTQLRIIAKERTRSAWNEKVKTNGNSDAEWQTFEKLFVINAHTRRHNIRTRALCPTKFSGSTPTLPVRVSECRCVSTYHTF